MITLILQRFDQKNREVVLVLGQLFGTGTRYGIKVLRQFDKKVKTKSQKVLGINSYVYKS